MDPRRVDGNETHKETVTMVWAELCCLKSCCGEKQSMDGESLKDRALVQMNKNLSRQRLYSVLLFAFTLNSHPQV